MQEWIRKRNWSSRRALPNSRRFTGTTTTQADLWVQPSRVAPQGHRQSRVVMITAFLDASDLLDVDQAAGSAVPLGLGCSILGMRARPTCWMRPRWPRLRCTILGFAWSAPRITALVCGCCRTAGMISPRNEPGLPPP